MLNFSRRILNSLLPSGWAWTPKPVSDYDKLLDGIADNSGVIYSDLKLLSCLRCPDTTPILSDLEKEYAVVPFSGATDAQRRQSLKAFMFRRANSGAYDILQEKLRDAGFTDVYVIPNDPAVDPDIFLAQDFNMVCGDLLPGGNEAQCGEPEAICSSVGGELLVNGDLFQPVLNYVNLCGETGIECGDDVYAGDFDGYNAALTDIQYAVPADSGYWPLIFFVGGAPSYDEYGYLDEIQLYPVPSQRRVEFRRTILKFKPMHSWGALIVQYV